MRAWVGRHRFEHVKLQLLGRPLLPDTVIGVVLATYAQLEIWYPRAAIGVGDVNGSKAILVPTALAMTLPVALRRRFPLVVAVTVMVATAFQNVLTTPTQGLAGIVAGLLALYSVGAYAEPASAAIAGATAFAAVAGGAKGGGDLAFGTLIFGGALLAGVAVRRRHLREQELERETRKLTHERDAAVATERARLARELHDVVAHSVSTMVVQAQAGGSLLDTEPARAHEALRAIERAGRQALVELRHLLGLLRDDEAAAAFAPQPGLRELSALLETFRSAGLSVELRAEGEAVTLPPGLDLTAYRIVQEALTNSLKHAAPAAAEVVLRYFDHAVEVEIIDTGSRRAPANGVGQGLIGMRERVALYGGQLETGPRDGGGFLVRARLPVEP
jgi:signal transduction histidine kinase